MDENLFENSSCSKIEILFELFCPTFCSLLKLNDRGGVAMDFAWWTRSTIFGHWPRDGIRMRSFRLHVYECWLRSYWKRRRGYDPCTPTTFVSALSFQSFHRPLLNGTKTRTKGHCLRQRQRNILWSIFLKVLFRKPGNRNLTFIPRGNNTTPFQNVRTTRFFSQIPLEKNLPCSNNVRILRIKELHRRLDSFPQFPHSKLRSKRTTILASTIIIS